MVERKAANNKNHQQKLLKISKKEKIKQVNSLIKLLRPKVYITDTSSFKNLVQDLTGNNNNNNNNNATIISNPSPPPPPPPPHNNLETLQNLPWDYIDQVAAPDTSVETISLVSDSSNDSFEFLNQFLPREEELISQQSYQQILMLESFPIFDADHPWYEPEVSIYDYELPGLFV